MKPTESLYALQIHCNCLSFDWGGPRPLKLFGQVKDFRLNRHKVSNFIFTHILPSFLSYRGVLWLLTEKRSLHCHSYLSSPLSPPFFTCWVSVFHFLSLHILHHLSPWQPQPCAGRWRILCTTIQKQRSRYFKWTVFSSSAIDVQLFVCVAVESCHIKTHQSKTLHFDTCNFSFFMVLLLWMTKNINMHKM